MFILMIKLNNNKIHCLFMPIELCTVPPQIFISHDKPIKNNMNNIITRKNKDKKPFGGLWTSKKIIKDNVITSPWLKWAKKHKFYDNNNILKWELRTNSPCKILKIESKKDIEKYSIHYNHDIDGDSYKFDWDYIFTQKECDAMWLTETGMKNLTTVFTDKKYSMAGWDVESILWSNWVFDEIIQH